MSANGVIESTTCLGCGCACDDIDVVIDGDRIAEARNTCALGAAWFGDGRVPSRCLVAGHEGTPEEALATGAELLGAARRALVYLAPELSCEAQRSGIAIADLLGGVVDSTTTDTALSPLLATQERGCASATLGELRNRADIVVFWAVNLERRYPRFAARYAPLPSGAHLSGGRSSRTVLSVDIGRATGPADADRRIAIDPADEVATLVALRAIVSATDSERGRFAALDARAWQHAHALAPTLLAGRYVALVYDAEPDERATRSPSWFDAIAGLAQALNDATRCAAVAMRAGGNRSGADAMLTAQTGYPLAVDFARGHPRYRPHDGSALGVLTRRAVDAALVLGDASLMPPSVASALATIRHVLIGPRASTSSTASTVVAIDTGRPGIHSGGTALRTDDVPLPLRPSLPGLSTTEALVTSLARHLLARANT